VGNGDPADRALHLISPLLISSHMTPKHATAYEVALILKRTVTFLRERLAPANVSSKKVAVSRHLYLEQFRDLIELLHSSTAFYRTPGNTYDEAHQRLAYLKDVIENKGGHRFFWSKGEPLHREEDLHILYRMTWFATEADVSTEVNDGRGPADFKISKGRQKSIVEFKLAKNKGLEKNLTHQTEIYQKASDAQHGIKAIVYFTREELEKVQRMLKKLKLDKNRNVVLINARRDDKPSGSKA
jgi:hypothetical protein